jgi:hypothetical protein
VVVHHEQQQGVGQALYNDIAAFAIRTMAAHYA